MDSDKTEEFRFLSMQAPSVVRPKPGYHRFNGSDDSDSEHAIVATPTTDGPQEGRAVGGAIVRADRHDGVVIGAAGGLGQAFGGDRNASGRVESETGDAAKKDRGAEGGIGVSLLLIDRIGEGAIIDTETAVGIEATTKADAFSKIFKEADLLALSGERFRGLQMPEVGVRELKVGSEGEATVPKCKETLLNGREATAPGDPSATALVADRTGAAFFVPITEFSIPPPFNLVGHPPVPPDSPFNVIRRPAVSPHFPLSAVEQALLPPRTQFNVIGQLSAPLPNGVPNLISRHRDSPIPGTPLAEGEWMAFDRDGMRTR